MNSLAALCGGILSAAVAVGAAPVIQHEAGETRLTGLERFDYGGYSYLQDTVSACLSAALKVRGEDLSYDEVRGLSGMAFRLLTQWPWTPAAAEPRDGYDCTQVAARALGLELEWLDVPPEDVAAVAAARQRAADRIASGWPVLLYERFCAIGVGCREEGKILLCRAPGGGKPGYVPFKSPVWTFGYLSPARSRPTRRESVVRALKLAVELAETPKHGDYTSGLAAYERWAADLTNEAYYTGQTKGQLDQALWTNGYCYGSLFNARQSAEKFLRSAAPEFEPQTAKPLLAAAEHYHQVQQALAPGDPFPWGLWPRDFDRQKKAWDQPCRQAQAENLVKAMNLETKAIDQIRIALEQLGPG